MASKITCVGWPPSVHPDRILNSYDVSLRSAIAYQSWKRLMCQFLGENRVAAAWTKCTQRLRSDNSDILTGSLLLKVFSAP
jgi:hypothetical protein